MTSEGGCHASPIDRLYTPRQLANDPRNVLLLGHHVSIVIILIILLLIIIIFIILFIMVNICMPTRQAWLSMWSQTKQLEANGDSALPGRLSLLIQRLYGIWFTSTVTHSKDGINDKITFGWFLPIPKFSILTKSHVSALLKVYRIWLG